ncbi:MAG: hypothetical protein R3F12_10790 [Lysobacteraceae bacterium]|nr:hypothetical protein [Xanthomonadaceae bacterium]HRY00606.1 hypothetical protein [Xanthomonadaceae bacterium]
MMSTHCSFRRRLGLSCLLLALSWPVASQSVPPSEGGAYRLLRMRVAAGTMEVVSPEAGAPRYRLQATVGQAEADPDAAVSPRYRLRGGFWAARGIGDTSQTLFSDGFED